MGKKLLYDDMAYIHRCVCCQYIVYSDSYMPVKYILPKTLTWKLGRWFGAQFPS